MTSPSKKGKARTAKNGGNRPLQTAAWVCVILAVWEAAPRLGLVSSFILPPFTKVVATMIREIATGNLGLQIGNSLLLVLEGFLISLVLAVVLSTLSVRFRVVESLCDALCVIFTPLPGVAMLPLIMMWFGVSSGAMLALIVHSVLWPILADLTTGFRSVPVIYRDYAKNIGMTSYQTVFYILIFSVMPYLLSGIKIGWGRSWRALISSEMIFGMIGSLGGLGYYIYTNRAYAKIECVMAGVLCVIVIGILAEVVLFRLVERNTNEKWGMTNG